MGGDCCGIQGGERLYHVDYSTRYGIPKRSVPRRNPARQALTVGAYWPVRLNESHDTFECQFENVPAGLSFHAQTWSV
jgi:hypothetical protein